MRNLVLLAAGGVALATAGGASATTPKGYRVTYVADRGHYCVTPVTAGEAERLGIALYRTECHSKDAWATIGFSVTRA